MQMPPHDTSTTGTCSDPGTGTPPRVVNPKALFVTQLSLETEFIDLQGHFDRFGEIVLCRVLKDAKTGVSRGIGYVNFDREEDAAAAQAQLDGKPGPKGEEQLSVKFAEVDPSYKAVATTKVFVRYVPVDFTVEDVRKHFSVFGSITNINIDSDRSRAVRKGATPWNYAYVTFTTVKEANAAIARGAKEVQWSTRAVTVKPAEGDETRQLRSAPAAAKSSHQADAIAGASVKHPSSVADSMHAARPLFSGHPPSFTATLSPPMTGPTQAPPPPPPPPPVYSFPTMASPVPIMAPQGGMPQVHQPMFVFPDGSMQPLQQMLPQQHMPPPMMMQQAYHTGQGLHYPPASFIYTHFSPAVPQPAPLYAVPHGFWPPPTAAPGTAHVSS